MYAHNISNSDEFDVPPHIWEILHQLLLGINDKKLDLRVPQPKKTLEAAQAYIIFAYGMLAVYGVFSNVLLLVHILHYRLYKDPTYSFIINNLISDIYKCCVVLPFTLYVLLIQNWMLGELLCSFLPMLQDTPLHVTMLTYIFLVWDRYRYLRNPSKPRLPAFVCTVGSWLTSICLVLPYPIYITHIDLGMYFKTQELDGVSICIVNLTDDMKEYMRGIFLVTYAGPLATISYFLVCCSRELTYHSNSASVYFDTRTRSRHRTDSSSTTATTELRSYRGASYSHQGSRCSSISFNDHGRTRVEVHEPELDIAKEKRTQTYLASMITVNAVCLGPLMIVKLARLALAETYDNSSHFDYTYVVIVWVAFLPACITPIIFACWQMSRSSKRRLKGYFRFSNRKFRRSCEMVVPSNETPSGTPQPKSIDGSDEFQD